MDSWGKISCTGVAQLAGNLHGLVVFQKQGDSETPLLYHSSVPLGMASAGVLGQRALWTVDPWDLGSAACVSLHDKGPLFKVCCEGFLSFFSWG